MTFFLFSVCLCY